MRAGNGEWGMGNGQRQEHADRRLRDGLLPFPIPYSPFPAGGAGP